MIGPAGGAGAKQNGTIMRAYEIIWRIAALRRGLLAAAVAASVALAAFGSAAEAALTPEDRADIARVEEYLNKIRTLRAGFIQTAPDGSVSEGELYLRRPGRLRFEYDPPSPLLVVADGIWLVLHDRKLEQVDRWPVYETPLGVLVAARIELQGGDVRVVDVERRPGILELQLVDTERPEEGSLTLVFSDDPLVLRQWYVTDAQGGVTTVAIADAEVNVGLDPELFVFNDPAPGSQHQNR